MFGRSGISTGQVLPSSAIIHPPSRLTFAPLSPSSPDQPLLPTWPGSPFKEENNASLERPPPSIISQQQRSVHLFWSNTWGIFLRSATGNAYLVKRGIVFHVLFFLVNIYNNASKSPASCYLAFKSKAYFVSYLVFLYNPLLLLRNIKTNWNRRGREGVNDLPLKLAAVESHKQLKSNQKTDSQPADGSELTFSPRGPFEPFAPLDPWSPVLPWSHLIQDELKQATAS